MIYAVIDTNVIVSAYVVREYHLRRNFLTQRTSFSMK